VCRLQPGIVDILEHFDARRDLSRPDLVAEAESRSSVII
jgi:hypothetical protein